MDGKIFDVKDAVQGENTPPLHPNCRSTIIPFISEEYAPKTRIARDPETGKNYYIENMNYREWKKEYVNNKSFNEGNNRNKKSGELHDIPTYIGKSYKQVEDIIRFQNTETLIAYGKNGEVRYAVTENNKSQVGLDNKMDKMLKRERLFVSHNHPSGSTFSEQDIKTALKYNLLGVRAVTKDKIYSLSPIKQWPTKEILDKNIKEVKAEYKNIIKNRYDGKIPKDKRKIIHNNMIRRIAKKSNLNYNIINIRKLN